MINEKDRIQNIIDGFKNKEGMINVLEAGCGSLSRFTFDNNYFISGIDISAKQLERNINVKEKILGDLQTFRLPENKFDIVMCIHVLEHLSHPEYALDNLFKSIKNQGVAIISSPDPLSIKGLVTKLTPHWFHIFVYRNFYGIPEAGKEDTAPFKTFMRLSMSKKAVIKRAEFSGFICEFMYSSDALLSKNWVSASIKNRSKILYGFLKFLVISMKIMTLGIVGDSEYSLVLRKQ